MASTKVTIGTGDPDAGNPVGDALFGPSILLGAGYTIMRSR